MPRIRCPYCGAEYEAPMGVEYAVCPYCGTSIRVDAGSTVKQYYYPIRLDEQDAYTVAVSRAAQMPGSPKGFEKDASFTRAELHVVPLYICRAGAVAEGVEAAREEVEEAFLATRGGVLPGLSEEYQFPTVGRVPYDPSALERVDMFHQVSTGPRERCRLLERRAASRAAREAALAKRSTSIKTESTIVGIAMYPFWLVEYSHSLRQGLRALVDAVSAEPVYVEYPIPGAKRALLLGLSLTAYIAAAAIGAGAALALKTAIPLLGALAAGAGAVIPGLRRATARLGRYILSYKKGERVAVELREH